MDAIPTFLGSLPVIGYVFQFIGYVLANLPVIAQTTVAVAVPITLAALTGVMCERSGVVNIGLEGIMLIAAFVGWVAGAAAVSFFPADPGPIFGVTPALLIGLIAAILAGMAVSLLHAWLSISLRVDQIISGTIINIGAAGLTGYLNSLISRQSPTGAGSFTPLVVPSNIADLPLIGWLINALFNQGPIGITTCSSSWGSRSCCSGRAGDSGRVPRVRTRGPPRRSALTSSGFATETSCCREPWRRSAGHGSAWSRPTHSSPA